MPTVLNAIARPSEKPDFAGYAHALNKLNERAENQFPATMLRGTETVETAAVLNTLRSVWATVFAQLGKEKFYEARQSYTASIARADMNGLVAAIVAQLEAIDADLGTLERKVELATKGVLLLQILAGIVCILAYLVAARESAREATARALAVRSSNTSREQVLRLFEMTDMLQSAGDHTDANAVLRSTASELIPGFGGALYVFNNSRDRLALSTSWQMPDDEQPTDTIGIQHCWA